MPSEDTASTLGVVLSHSKIDLQLFGQYVGSDIVIAKKCHRNWVYVLNCDTHKTFEEFDRSITALDSHLTSRSPNTPSYFIPVMGTESGTSDKILIGALGSPILEEVFDEDTGKLKQPVDIWQMKSIVPPRKRTRMEEDDPSITGLMKLSKQLHIDFSINVYGDNGKRKRNQPTRSMDRDTTAIRNTKEKKHAAVSLPATKKKTQNAKHRHAENAENKKFTLKEPTTTEITVSMMLESLAAAHSEALAAKKEIIRTMEETHTASIQEKEQVIKRQAVLIGKLLESRV